MIVKYTRIDKDNVDKSNLNENHFHYSQNPMDVSVINKNTTSQLDDMRLNISVMIGKGLHAVRI